VPAAKATELEKVEVTGQATDENKRRSSTASKTCCALVMAIWPT
jgi:hypothetical protein